MIAYILANIMSKKITHRPDTADAEEHDLALAVMKEI